MFRFHRKYYQWLRHIPRRKTLKGGRLHKLLGDRLFAPGLWKPTRHGVAGGLALGLFIGFMPTMGVQMILSVVSAYFLRVNIPLAIAGAFVTNPLTAAIIYPLEYQLGLKLVGLPAASEEEGYGTMLRNFSRHAKPLWAGSLAVGGVFAAIAYGLVLIFWKEKPESSVEGSTRK